MNVKLRLSILALACLTVPLFAAESEGPTEELQQLGSLVGKVWVGEFPGGNMTDEQRFEWIFEKKFLRNTHRVIDAEGKVTYEGETIFAWHPAGQTLVWWYFNATGGFITGTITESEAGWEFEGINHSPPPQPPRVRGLWKIVSEDEWQSTQYFYDSGEWKETFTITFRPKE